MTTTTQHIIDRLWAAEGKTDSVEHLIEPIGDATRDDLRRALYRLIKSGRVEIDHYDGAQLLDRTVMLVRRSSIVMDRETVRPGGAS